MLKEIYKKAKQEFISSKKYDVPERYQSSFVHWGGGVDAQRIYSEFIKKHQGHQKENQKILIVGVMGGRDYFLFKNLGYEVVALDIGPQPDISNIDFFNIEEDLPYPDCAFDIVLIGEVLEHLKNDIGALKNIHRVLKDDGNLIVSLPFFNDWEAGHMRVHSPKSGSRLLEMSGFEVLDFVERPGLIWPPLMNYVNHGLSFISYALRGKGVYKKTVEFFGALEWRLGHLRFLSPIRRMSRHYGGYYFCAKKLEVLDHIQLNRSLYTSSKS